VDYRRHGDYVKRFRELLDTAIRDRLRTDRVGIEMSGGLDSTALAAIAQNLQSQQPGSPELRAYTIVHDPLIPDQERHYSTLAAEHLGIPIRHYEVARYQLFEGVERPDARRPAPFHQPQIAARLELSREVSLHQRVVLTGYDGDALLSESPKPYFRSLFRQRRFGRLLYGMARYAISQRRLLPHGVRHRHGVTKPGYPKWLDQDLEARYGLRERWEQISNRPPSEHAVRPYAHTVLGYLTELPDVFDNFDAGVSLCPVEYRHPLMDLRLVEYCLSLPPWPWCVQKQILRTALRGLLPGPVLLRPKTPLAAHPHIPLLREPQMRWLDQWVATPGLERYVNRANVPGVFGQEDAEETWTNLRPLSLNFWLKSLIANNQGGTS
jgi:asparagine synthase (glutamine-hydrolysing)